MTKKERSQDESVIANKIKWWFYNLKVWLHNHLVPNKPRKTGRIATKKVKESLFIAAVLFIPLTIFTVFYIGVNINCILISFKDYNMSTGGYDWAKTPFHHFTEFFDMLLHEEFMGYAIKNSIILFLVSILFNLPMHILNAYYVYKKHLFHKFYRLILFLPSILASVITVTLFKYFLIYGLDSIYELFNLGEAPSLLSDVSTGFATTVCYSAWITFGGGIIMFLGLMNRISPSIIEAAALDGVKPLQEFRYIILPLIFPTISIYIINMIAGFFAAQGSLFTFYGPSAKKEFYTFGYYYYIKVIGNAGTTRYPMAAASGIIFTLIVAPITLLARYLLNRLAPPVES